MYAPIVDTKGLIACPHAFMCVYSPLSETTNRRLLTEHWAVHSSELHKLKFQMKLPAKQCPSNKTAQTHQTNQTTFALTFHFKDLLSDGSRMWFKEADMSAVWLWSTQLATTLYCSCTLPYTLH